MGEREVAQIKAAALREAADAAESIDGWIDPAGWLRDRADQIESDAPESQSIGRGWDYFGNPLDAGGRVEP